MRRDKFILLTSYLYFFIETILCQNISGSSLICKHNETEINGKCVDCSNKYNRKCFSCDKYACSSCVEGYYADFKGSCLPCSEYSNDCQTCTDKQCLAHYSSSEYDSSNTETGYVNGIVLIASCDQNIERGGENCCINSYFFNRETFTCHSCKVYHELCRECNYKDCTQCFNTKEKINGKECKETGKVNFTGVIMTILIVLLLAVSLFFFAKYILIKFKIIKIAEPNTHSINSNIPGNQVNIVTPNEQNKVVPSNLNIANNPYAQDLNMINSDDRFKGGYNKEAEYENVDNKSSFYAPGEEGSVIKSNIDNTADPTV